MNTRYAGFFFVALTQLSLACSDAGGSNAAGGAAGNHSGSGAGAGHDSDPGTSEAGQGADDPSGSAGDSGGGDVHAGGGGSAGTSSGSVSAARFFLPTGEPDNTAAPSIEVDAQGGTHAVYPAYAGGNAYYAYCPADCRGESDVKVVTLPTEGTVANAMLALDSNGRPRVLLSAFQKLYYASCDSGCTSANGWKIDEILDHDGDREVSGEALALDPSGHPRFLMHTYRAYLGIGQKTPKTWYATCDSACGEAASWSYSEIAQEIWEGTSLRFDRAGGAHIATVINVNEGERAGQKLSAYLECKGECTTEDDWNGIGFIKPYESATDAVTVRPTVSLALTRAGAPRVVVLGENEGKPKNIIYFQCDQDCAHDNWQGAVVSNHDQIDAGLDLALDANDHPRLVYTLNYNIGLAYCDSEPCGGPAANWDLTKVELSGDIPPDEIFLWENCTVGAWFLHSPSLALTKDGKPRVGYQARDISGGVTRPDPTKPACRAGTDMTWSRLSLMASYK
ncbi:MAG TPA: hypothetical protein VFK05_24400 [Polyangiaceae bacterium]|nr:hypothetical protein [Polyangiaceae bacterium]